MADAAHQFGNIFLTDRGAGAQGQLKMHSGGVLWKKAGGERKIELSKADITALLWAKVSRGCQLIVKDKGGHSHKFHGFRDADLETLKAFSSSTLGKEIESRAMSISGHNWGEAQIDGHNLAFNVGGKTAFDVPLGEVSQVATQGKNEVQLEFNQDDTMGANDKDSLVEISFFIPPTSAKYPGDEENPSSKVFLEALQEKVEVGDGGAAGEAVCTFDEVGIITPRGRFDVECHYTCLKLVGQNMDFKIQYSSIVRLFVLPKSNQPHTIVVISLDPPVRRGQTYYPHMLMQFPTEEEIEKMDLDISPESFASKNAQHGDKLQMSYTGQTWDVFVRVLRGLAGAKITRPGQFRNHTGDAHAVRTSLKADDGYLYPLEKCFFYIQKPPTLITYDEVESVEFERQGGGIGTSSFDLAVRLKNDTEHKFRSIAKQEYSNLFNFLSAKKLRIDNIKEQKQGGGALRGMVDDEDIDPHMNRVKAGADDFDDSEDDEDFKADSDASDGDQSSGGSDSEGSDSDGGGSEEDRPKKEKGEKKRKATPTKKDKVAPKKKKAKKDKDAPKNALSAFMFFSQAKRESVKEENPDASFGELGKLLGQAWKAMDDESKKEFNDKAAADKIRYQEERSGVEGHG